MAKQLGQGEKGDSMRAGNRLRFVWNLWGIAWVGFALTAALQSAVSVCR